MQHSPQDLPESHLAQSERKPSKAACKNKRKTTKKSPKEKVTRERVSIASLRVALRRRYRPDTFHRHHHHHHRHEEPLNLRKKEVTGTDCLLVVGFFFSLCLVPPSFYRGAVNGLGVAAAAVVVVFVVVVVVVVVVAVVVDSNPSLPPNPPTNLARLVG